MITGYPIWYLGNNFEHMPLTYRDRGSSGTQLEIRCGAAVVGRLWKAVLSVTAGQEVRWNWTWHSGPSSGPQKHGTADTIDQAKAQLEQQWRAWLRAAELEEKVRGGPVDEQC